MGKHLSASNVSLCFYLKPAAGDQFTNEINSVETQSLCSPFQDSTAYCKELVK